MDMAIDTNTPPRMTEGDDLIKLSTINQEKIHRQSHEEVPQATEGGDGAPMEGP